MNFFKEHSDSKFIGIFFVNSCQQEKHSVWGAFLVGSVGRNRTADRRQGAVWVAPPRRVEKKMPSRKPEIFSGFLRFSPFSGTSLAKCDCSQNSNSSKNKKMPNADVDLLHGIGLMALTSDRFFDIMFILENHNSQRGEYGITN